MEKIEYNQRKTNWIISMRIAICDDEKSARDLLLQMLWEYPEAFSCLDTYESGEEFLESGKNYDLLFLDIDMKGMDGIETARKIRLRDKKLKIVYVTAYREYAGKAFSVHAFGYLLKPVKKERLFAQIEDAKSYREDEKQEEEPLEFMTTEGRTLLLPGDIYYFEFWNRKIRLCTKEGILEMKGKIGDVRDRMEKYGFAAPHKSFVVNLERIKNIKGYEIFLMNGACIPLSQKQAVGFKETLSKYLADRKEV